MRGFIFWLLFTLFASFVQLVVFFTLKLDYGYAIVASIGESAGFAVGYYTLHILGKEYI